MDRQQSCELAVREAVGLHDQRESGLVLCVDFCNPLLGPTFLGWKKKDPLFVNDKNWYGLAHGCLRLTGSHSTTRKVDFDNQPHALSSSHRRAAGEREALKVHGETSHSVVFGTDSRLFVEVMPVTG